MKTREKINIVRIRKESSQWKLHQNLGKLIERLDRRLDQSELHERKGRCAPQQMIDLLF